MSESGQAVRETKRWAGIGNDWPVLPGVALVSGITVAAYLAIRYTALGVWGLSSLTLAIMAGAILGNALPKLGSAAFRPGLAFAQRRMLRTGVALYGFNLSVQQIALVGSTGILVDVAMVCSTLAAGWWIGRRVLGMDRETVLLASAGSAICGAAAVMATMPMLSSGDAKADESVAEKSTVAVATVVLFGTLAMILYPLFYAWIGSGHFDFGIFVGSTVHEVAQVVAIGSTLGGDVAGNAVIAKMIRVMLLVPFLLMLGLALRRRGSAGTQASLPIPWFALAFVAMAGINSLQILPAQIVDALRIVGMLLLTAAMASLGIDTTLGRMRQAGMRPILLGGGLFLHLIVIGGLVNWLVA